jgi:hypothetical protein
MSMTEEVVDVRCPVGPRRDDGSCHPGKLLLKIRQSGERPTWVHPDNLIELYCEDCTRRLRKSGRPVRRVLHRYDFLGTLVETLVVEGRSSEA